MSKRFENNSKPTELKPGEIELEMGIPIPGVILEKELWIQTAIKKLPERGPIDWTSIFQREAPIVLDIGCGNGRFSISSAVRRPEWNHIAIDVLPAVIRYGTRRGNQRGLSNLRFAVCDGWRFLVEYVAPNSIDEIHIYHPQPYANPLDASKRMLTPEFLVWTHDRLKQGGAVFLQTDRAEYWNYIRSTVSAIMDWVEVDSPWSEDPRGRSRREVLSNEQGMTLYRGIGKKRSNLSTEEAQRIAADLEQPKFQVDSVANKDGKRPFHRRPYNKRRRRSD
jgi:tRNA (guanine-N7-)-methyltransferase